MTAYASKDAHLLSIDSLVMTAELANKTPRRLADWRARSFGCALVDVLALAAGVSLIVISEMDSIASWPANDVLISPSSLERLAAILLLPAWIWMLASLAILGVVRRDPSGARPSIRMRWRSQPATWLLGATAIIVLATVVIGFVIGGAKGSTRILPGNVYQVSTLVLNGASWTTVSPAAFRVWEARFIREDAFFAYFGLFLVGGEFGLLYAHRRRLAASGLDS